MTTRLRFAPSPTGAIHLGNTRTALFNWLYARHTGGSFLLRVEDTDTQRNTDESVRIITEGMAWLGMHSDEETVFQSARRDEHLRRAAELVEKGHAYRCWCTPEEIEAMREKAVAEGRNPKYDGTWRDRTDAPDDDRPYVIRFRMPLDGETRIDDIVLGEITIRHEELDDFVIVRSDGTPVYNFVVVCDDAHMGITHVVRGQDHVNNTFKQWHIYRALGYEPPRFAHLPLIDGLSKRKGSASLLEYREMGYLPEAVINYLARLGWSHGDQELFTVQELFDTFDLADVNRGSGNFDADKLAWVNQQWIQRLDHEELARRVLPFLRDAGLDAEMDERLMLLSHALRERSPTLVDFVRQARFAYVAPDAYDDKATRKWMKAGARAAFEDLTERLAAAAAFDDDAIDAAFQGVMADHEVGMGKIAQPVRIALTGSSASPGIHETMRAVGQAGCIERMRAALALFPDP